MWITVGNTVVNTNNIVTIDTYCDEHDFGLIINGVKCSMGYSRYGNLKDRYKFERIQQIHDVLVGKVRDITGGSYV